MKHRGIQVIFRDMLFLILFVYILIALLAIQNLRPKQDAASSIPGNLIVEISWPNSDDTDVDLWVKAPNDRPVGYSNRGAKVFDLLRDDIGWQYDDSGLNYELAFSRGMPAGEYVVNVMLYADHSGSLPIPVRVRVSVRDSGGHSRQILFKDVKLEHVGEELTVWRFTLDKHGRVTAKNDLFMPLRAATP